MAAVVVFLLVTLPPNPIQVTWTGDPSIPARTVAGAYHVHTTRSDGAGDLAAVAAAARRSGLQFVIIADHGNGTAFDPPAYVDGILCIQGAEISTSAGHYVALGMARAPYPLGGEPAAVAEDVARLGGFGVVAHPDSPKASLAWADWNVPFDGLEWMNADSEWRNESRARLARVLFDYLLRPGPAMASVLDRPTSTLARWDALTARRRVVGLAGHDAHGGVGTTVEDGTRTSLVRVPSYDASFRSFTTRAVLERPFGGNAEVDAAAVLTAIRQGRVFTTIDALAGPGFLDFRRRDDGTVELHASTPDGARLVLLHNGEEADPAQVDWARASGAYRVEVRLADAPGDPPIPWLVSNPVYFLPPPAPSAPAAAPRTFAPVDLSWHVEKSMGSDGDLAGSEQEIAIDYRLRAGERASQFVALAGDLRGARPAGTVLAFEGVASRSMRVSVQVRSSLGGEERWAHSVYLDRTARHIVIPLDEMVPVDGQGGTMPPIARARSLLFVVDLVNALPGSSGTFRVSGVSVAR